MANTLTLCIGGAAGSIGLGTAPQGTVAFEPLELEDGAAGVRFDDEHLILSFRALATAGVGIEVCINGSSLGMPPVSSVPISRTAFPVTITLRKKGQDATLYACALERQAAAARVRNKALDLIESSDDDGGGDGGAGPGQG